MSNAGKRMINWKRDFPSLRVALGLLGKDGFTSMLVARYLLGHSCTARLRQYCRSALGRELNDETLQSRLKRPEELQWFEDNHPKAYAAGIRLKTQLAGELKKAGFLPFGVLG